MALFKIQNRQTGDFMVIRSRCSSGVRDVAVANAGEEGTVVWRDPSRSLVELIPHEGSNKLFVKGRKNG